MSRKTEAKAVKWVIRHRSMTTSRFSRNTHILSQPGSLLL